MIRRKILHRRLTEKNQFFSSFLLAWSVERNYTFSSFSSWCCLCIKLYCYDFCSGWEMKLRKIILHCPFFFQGLPNNNCFVTLCAISFLLKWLFLICTALYWSRTVLQKETCFCFVSRSSMDSLSVAIVLGSEIASSEFELVDGFLWAAFLLLSSSVSMKRKSLFPPALMHVTSFMHE